MSLFKVSPYKQFNQLVQNETFEPLFSWGLRMAIAASVPIAWGLATDQMEEASWITLVAEIMCWVELKGSFAQRLRVLMGGALLTFLFSILGSITGGDIWLSIAAMLLAGFLAGLFKNLGDRGAGLAVCIQVLFVISNAYPTHSMFELQERLALVLTGGVWTIFIGMAASVFLPNQQPYRRTIALIWRANAKLVQTIAKGWDGISLRSGLRDIYLVESEVRTTINNSFHFYETMAHQANKNEKEEYQLAQLRKATALVGTHIIAIGEELESVKIKELPGNLRVKLHDAFKALQQVLDRMAVFMITLKPEEELLIHSRINRLNKIIALLKEHQEVNEYVRDETLKRVTQLLERTIRLVETSINRLEEIGDDLPVFRSYSLIKTLFILHPKHWLRNGRLLFNFNTNNARYALRSAVAACIALFVYKWFKIDHGYWLPFTVLTVMQPYFTATFKKAIDRVIGTLAGGLAGGLLIRLPDGVYAREIMLFICFVFMVYFIRRQYAVAVFFITLSVVLLFDVEETLNPMLIITRALCTVGGASLGIIAGFAVFPTWDRKWLPVYLSESIACNYQYFITTFFSTQKGFNWTRHKRNAESKNSNAFDSFSRYLQEPFLGKKNITSYYHIINHCVRITRELNNIHLEQENRSEEPTGGLSEEQKKTVDECLLWYNKVIEEVKRLKLTDNAPVIVLTQDYSFPFQLTIHQQLYLDKLLIEIKALYKDLEGLNG